MHGIFVVYYSHSLSITSITHVCVMNIVNQVMHRVHVDTSNLTSQSFHSLPLYTLPVPPLILLYTRHQQPISTQRPPDSKIKTETPSPSAYSSPPQSAHSTPPPHPDNHQMSPLDTTPISTRIFPIITRPIAEATQ